MNHRRAFRNHGRRYPPSVAPCNKYNSVAVLNAERRTNPSRYVYDLDAEEGKRGVDRQIQIRVFSLAIQNRWCSSICQHSQFKVGPSAPRLQGQWSLAEQRA